MANDRNQTTRLDLLRALRARLDLEEGLGVGYVSASGGLRPEVGRAMAAAVKGGGDSAPAAPAAGKLTRPYRREAAAGAVAAPSPAVPPPPAVPRASRNPAKEEILAELRGQALHCEACEMARKRNSVVWGEGDPDAEVMFIGDAPGRDEDLQGRPFVGLPGKLLTDIIEKGMRIPRDSVYIAYAVKCRPPGNRCPLPDETAACSRHLAGQIGAIAPRVIVAVGEAAGRILLNLPSKTPDLRGGWLDYNGIPLRVTHHPSHLLRQRRAAASRTPADLETWNDIKEVMARMRAD